MAGNLHHICPTKIIRVKQLRMLIFFTISAVIASSSSTNSRFSCYYGSPPIPNFFRTSKNPGRMFIECSNYKDNPCKYFKWVDEIVSESSVEQLKTEKEKKTKN
ncbi:hypothetical protein LguiB_002236 [Lonicera macranthoides]